MSDDVESASSWWDHVTDDCDTREEMIRAIEARDRLVAQRERERIASFVEAHCCISSCCDAQPSAGETKALADCIRGLPDEEPST